jgi:hypothetical protein
MHDKRILAEEKIYKMKEDIFKERTKECTF